MQPADVYQHWIGITSRHIRRRTWRTLWLAYCGLCLRRWPCPEVRSARESLQVARSWWRV